MVLLQALLSGLALGGIYALVALGFSITHTTTKTLNFGQGEVGSLLLLAGKPYTAVLEPSDVTIGRYLLAMVMTLAVVGLIGVLLYYTAIRPFFGSGGMSWVMSTIGFGIILQNTAMAIWGSSSIATLQEMVVIPA